MKNVICGSKIRYLECFHKSHSTLRKTLIILHKTGRPLFKNNYSIVPNGESGIYDTASFGQCRKISITNEFSLCRKT